MRIEDLTSNLAITLFVIIDGQQLTFETKILEVHPRKHLVLAEPIYRNDKIVTFRKNDIHIDMLFNPGNDKPELFKDVSITLVKKSDGALCYNLATPNESVPCNRRENFRCFVGIPAPFQFGSSKTSHVGLIRDVSVNGFAIVTDEQISVEKGQMMHTSLKDFIEEYAEKHVFQLHGIVARIQVLDNGKTLYGCRLNSYIPALEAYIMKKERLRLKRTKGGTL